jgi:hypothetical protein
MKKGVLIGTVASLISVLLIGVLVEVWVRLTWDAKKGKPGFFVSDTERFEQLAPDYDGWFAGVPVHINNLGFRDTRDYALDKGPHTFRILVLGDSVTFGHGSVYEHTYPYLLEQRLKAWKPEVDWQVWNLGVPGYNTSQELTTLARFGASYRPDLVIVGFYDNDILDNPEPPPVTRRRLLQSEVTTWLRRHVYSYDWYRRRYLNIKSRFTSSDAERMILDGIASQEEMLSRPDQVALLKEQELTNPAPLPDDPAARHCTVAPPADFSRAAFEQTPGLESWKTMVRRFQTLNRSGAYRIVFFINAAPNICQSEDVFVSGIAKARDDYEREVMAAGTPVVSSHDAFLDYRPSDMPLAGGHSIGNSNAVKAGVLFSFLTTQTLPALLAQ